MYKFFSAVSNGKGKVHFFKASDVVKIMAQGNPENLSFSSHTSICYYKGIKGLEEDKWNKWEYDVDKDVLSIDMLNTTNDSKEVLKAIKRYLSGKDPVYLRNLYGCNSGDCNSGNRNSGNCNSGNWNSGNRNSGSCNSGNCNSLNIVTGKQIGRAHV